MLHNNDILGKIKFGNGMQGASNAARPHFAWALVSAPSIKLLHATHAMEKTLEARIGVQRIKCGFCNQPKGHLLRMLRESFFKPGECPVFVVQTRKERRKSVGVARILFPIRLKRLQLELPVSPRPRRSQAAGKLVSAFCRHGRLLAKNNGRIMSLADSACEVTLAFEADCK